MELVKAGADRQAMHEVIRQHSLAAWDALRQNASAPNPLAGGLSTDPEILVYLPAERVLSLLDASGYVGDAAYRARELAGLIRDEVG